MPLVGGLEALERPLQGGGRGGVVRVGGGERGGAPLAGQVRLDLLPAAQLQGACLGAVAGARRARYSLGMFSRSMLMQSTCCHTKHRSHWIM